MGQYWTNNFWKHWHRGTSLWKDGHSHISCKCWCPSQFFLKRFYSFFVCMDKERKCQSFPKTSACPKLIQPIFSLSPFLPSCFSSSDPSSSLGPLFSIFSSTALCKSFKKKKEITFRSGQGTLKIWHGKKKKIHTNRRLTEEKKVKKTKLTQVQSCVVQWKF